jgi:hypothetical protein
MHNEFEKDLEESGSSHHPGICLDGLGSTSVGIVRVPAESRTEHFPNASLELYRYTSLLGELTP